MQTDLRGRDVIDFSEWRKDEIDTVLDVAFELKRDRALGRAHPYLRDKVLAMLFFFPSTRTRASFEAGMAQLGGHAQFIESTHHPDRPRRHRQGDRRDPRPLQRRHRHPQRQLERGQRLSSRGRRGEPGAGPQHAVRRLPSAPGAGRSDDDHRALRRSAWSHRDDQLGVRVELSKAHQRAPEPGAVAAPFWYQRAARPPSRVRPDARDRGAGEAGGPPRPRLVRGLRTTSTRASRALTSSTRRVGGRSSPRLTKPKARS